jgi:hypothetical protein
MKQLMAGLLFLLCSSFLLIAEARDSFYQEIELFSNNSLTVINTNGPVTITSWNSRKMKINAVKMTYSWGGSSELSQVELKLYKNGDEVIVKTDIGNLDPESVVVMIDIRIPVGVPINSITTYDGQVSLKTTTGNTRIKAINSKIDVVDHMGSLTIDSSNGRISLEYIKGSVTVNSTNAPFIGIDIDGNTTVETTSGDIFLQDSGGTMGILTGKGKIDVENIYGSIRAETANGSITIIDIRGDVYGKSNRGTIRISDIDGFVSAWCEDGTVTIEDSFGISDVYNKNGSIRVDVEHVPAQGAKIYAGNGTVLSAVNPAIDLEVDAISRRGRVLIDSFRSVSKVTDEQYRITIGKASTKLLIEADNGNVTVTSM